MCEILITNKEFDARFQKLEMEGIYQDAIMYFLESAVCIKYIILLKKGLSPSEQLINALAASYTYCPDERLYTFRLIGKPALGPSPPVF